jgi:hypothetical protein
VLGGGYLLDFGVYFIEEIMEGNVFTGHSRDF